MKGALRLSIAALLVAPIFAASAAADTGVARASTPTTEIRVFASVPMAGPLRELGYEFEKHHPAVNVHYEFAATGVFVTGIEQGIPPDLLVSAGDQYQEKLTAAASVNLYSTLARDHLVAVVPCEPPPCCSRRGVRAGAVTQGNLVARLMDANTKVIIASPTLSVAGQRTVSIFHAIAKERPGAFAKIMGHAREVMDVGDVVQAVAQRRDSIGIAYASQVLALRRQGECVRKIALPRAYRHEMPFTVSVLNKSRFHYVGARRKKLDQELEAFYLSKVGERTFADWGFVPAKR